MSLTSSPPTSEQLPRESPEAWPSDAGAPPLFATRRDRTWLTDGPLVAVIAQALGKPLLPWQRHVVDVATEHRITPEGTREYHYKTVVVSVPRQTGKTTLIHALGVYRAMILGHDFFYTAQTGKDARARWMDLVKALRKSPAIKSRIKVALRGGSEHVEFPNGAVFQAFAPTEESLHGYTPPTVVLDEAFKHSAAAGDMLLGAISPAQQTIRARQLVIVSTMGHAGSTFLHDWIDRALESTPGVAGFVWGAGPEHDPYRLEDIPRFHPGVGFFLNDGILQPSDVLAEAERNSRAEYERAFANRRTRTQAHLIAPDTWHALGPDDDQVVELPPQLDGCVVTYDVALDRRSAGIVATWLDAGVPTSKVVASAPGVSWLADAIDTIDAQHKAALIASADHGPVLEVTAELRDRGIEVETLSERDFATSCGAFLTLVETAGLRHDGSEVLEASVTGLVTRTGVVDGVAFSRRHSVGDSSLGIATALGSWLVQRSSLDSRPVVYFGGT